MQLTKNFVAPRWLGLEHARDFVHVAGGDCRVIEAVRGGRQRYLGITLSLGRPFARHTYMVAE
jgi:hypothetical protein